MRSRGKLVACLAGFLVAAGLAVPLAAQQGRWEELNARVTSLYHQGKYEEATKTAQEALRVAEATFGPEHVSTATSLNNLAALYMAQSKYAEAEPLYKLSLAIREKTMGAEHPEVATTLENYAVMLRKTQRDAQAEKLEARAKAIRAKRPQ